MTGQGRGERKFRRVKPAKTELTETQHRVRTRLLWTVAVVVALGLGAFAIIGVDLAAKEGRTDTPFWSRVWSGAVDRFRSSKAKTNANVDAQVRDLERRVFPQFETKK